MGSGWVLLCTTTGALAVRREASGRAMAKGGPVLLPLQRMPCPACLPACPLTRLRGLGLHTWMTHFCAL